MLSACLCTPKLQTSTAAQMIAKSVHRNTSNHPFSSWIEVKSLSCSWQRFRLKSELSTFRAKAGGRKTELHELDQLWWTVAIVGLRN